MKQCGFLSGIALYGLIGAVAVAGGLGIALKIQSSRLDTAKAELALCAMQYKQALESIQKQNEGVKALKEASEQARDRARIAVASVKAAQQGVVKERERLALLAKKPATGPCPAGAAVTEIKKGLKQGLKP